MTTLDCLVDSYNCVQIIDERLLAPPVDTKWFDSALKHSIKKWQESKYKAVWLQLPTQCCHLLPIAIQHHSFVSHHSTESYFMLVKELSSKNINNIPCYGHHMIGVGGFVLNKSLNKLLMIQENSGPSVKYNLWKLPGGLVEYNELITDAVEREIFEETGIKTNFSKIGCIIEMMPNNKNSKNSKNMKNSNKNEKAKEISDKNKNKTKNENRKVKNSFYVNNPSRGQYGRDIYCMCLCIIDENYYNNNNNNNNNSSYDSNGDLVLKPQESEIAKCEWIDIDRVFNKMPLYKDAIKIGVWSQGLRICYDIATNKDNNNNNNQMGLNHDILPFGRGQASIYLPNNVKSKL